MDKLIQITDSNNQPLRAGTKQEAWTQGLWHWVAHVTIFSPDGKILVQRRAPGKFPFPALWDNSVSGHVDAGETHEQAARRELLEELGIVADDQLEFVGEFELHYQGDDWGTINRHDKAYRLVLPEDTDFRLAKDEVGQVAWRSLEEIKQQIKTSPEQFAYPFLQIMQKLY